MIKIHRVIFNLMAITCLIVTSLHAQNNKKHTERFDVDSDVMIYINSSHTNVDFETWDKDEVEVTFIMESDENVETPFKKWNFSATGGKDKIEIESSSNFDFNIENFQFDFDIEDLNLDMEGLELNLANLDFDFGNMDIIVDDMLEGMNLDDLPESPFGEHINFNGDKYERDPDAYLKKMNEKHGTQITKAEVDRWMEDLEEWGKNIEINMEGKTEAFKELEKSLDAQSEELEKTMEKWEKENRGKIEEMTKKIEEQIKDMNFEQFEQFDHFDQNNSKVRKTIKIKMPKKAKLNLNVRYGEVSLADNTRNMNADLNYATLSAKTIQGVDTDISASFAPVYISHWQDGKLSVNHCNQITIEEATKITLDAQGTDILIGTLLSSGILKSAYGNLEIKNLEDSLEDLKITLDFGSALVNSSQLAIDVNYEGKGKSFIDLSEKFKVLKDTKEGKLRKLNAYHQKQNSGKVLAINSNFGDLTIK